MRAECVNAMLETFSEIIDIPAIILVGNHDRINEKSSSHALEFLDNDFTDVRANPFEWANGIHLVPYQHDLPFLKAYLRDICPGSVVIMHQGLQGSDSGDYFQDPTALAWEDVAHLRVISGHYHRRQDIKTGPNGLFSYIGNPYTLGFGEANHPPKGFQILNNDGSLEFVPTNLRRHIIFECDLGSPMSMMACPKLGNEDLLWMKARGKPSGTNTKDFKSYAASYAGINIPFKFEHILDEQHSMLETLKSTSSYSDQDLMDQLIDSLSNTDDAQKERLKHLWKGLLV
jgi:hypothetical protein